MTTNIAIVYNFGDVESKIAAAYVAAKCECLGIEYILYNVEEYSEDDLRSVLNEQVKDDNVTVFFAGYSFEKKVGDSWVYETHIINELSEIGNVIWCDNAFDETEYSNIKGIRDEKLHKYMTVEAFFDKNVGILPYNFHKENRILNGTLYSVYKEVMEYVENHI